MAWAALANKCPEPGTRDAYVAFKLGPAQVDMMFRGKFGQSLSLQTMHMFTLLTNMDAGKQANMQARMQAHTHTSTS